LQRVQSDVLRFHPAVVIVALGSNDPGHTPPGVWEGNWARSLCEWRHTAPR
jgi:hypothetical protein